MFRIGLKIKYLGLVASLALVMVSIGCSDSTGPEMPGESALYEPGYVFENPEFVVIYGGSKYEPQITMSQIATEVVSAEDGGTLTNGRVTLHFPPGALDEDTEISMTMDDTGLYITDLGPEGIEFDEPVLMTFDLVGTSAEGNAASTFIAWFNHDTGQWEMIDNLPPAHDSQIRGNLWHFSKYSGIGG